MAGNWIDWPNGSMLFTSWKLFLFTLDREVLDMMLFIGGFDWPWSCDIENVPDTGLQHGRVNHSLSHGHAHLKQPIKIIITSTLSSQSSTNNHFLFFIFECRNPVLNFKTSTNKKNIRLKVLKSKKKKLNQWYTSLPWLLGYIRNEKQDNNNNININISYLKNVVWR